MAFTDPFGLKLCFRGPDAEKAKSTVESSTGTSISVDRDNCATGYTSTEEGKHKKYSEIQGKLGRVIDDQQHVVYAYYSGMPGFNPYETGLKPWEANLYVGPGDGALLHTWVGGCTTFGYWRGFLSKPHFQGENQRNIHEIQHAFDFVNRTLGSKAWSEARGVAAEDGYNGYNGSPLRCAY